MEDHQGLNPDPDEGEIRHALEGNFCRCTGYQNIVAAIGEAAQRMREAETQTVIGFPGPGEPGYE